MTAFIVASWAAYAWAQRRRLWASSRASRRCSRWFTKAAAAFFVAALVLDAAFSCVVSARTRSRRLDCRTVRRGRARRGWTLAGVALATQRAIVVSSFRSGRNIRFYNWQMSVTRKPCYSVRALWIARRGSRRARRLHPDVAVLVAATRADRPDRALALGPAGGAAARASGRCSALAELSCTTRQRAPLHDVHPALSRCLRSSLARPGALISRPLLETRGARWVGAPAPPLLTYIVSGGLVRLAFIYQVRPTGASGRSPGDGGSLLLFVWGRPVSAWLSRQQIRRQRPLRSSPGLQPPVTLPSTGSGPGIEPRKTTPRRSRSGRSWSRAHSSMGSWPTGCRSKTGSAPFSSAAVSATTTIGWRATMCDIF